MNKYQRNLKGVTVDVYDVLKAFNVTCPAMQHGIKKMLAAGQRGHKDVLQDKREAIQSIERSIELDGDEAPKENEIYLQPYNVDQSETIRKIATEDLEFGL